MKLVTDYVVQVVKIAAISSYASFYGVLQHQKGIEPTRDLNVTGSSPSRSGGSSQPLSQVEDGSNDGLLVDVEGPVAFSGKLALLFLLIRRAFKAIKERAPLMEA